MKGEKAARLELLLRAHPEGLRKAEIARRIGVHRSTVSRYLEELKLHTKINEENNLITLAEKPDDETLSLSVYESLAFNLSAELLAENTEIQNPHLVTGLRKIATGISSYAPSVGESILRLAEDLDRKAAEGGDSGLHSKAMEVLIDGWALGKIVRVRYEGAGGEEMETEFAPYFIGFADNETGRRPISVTGRLRHSTDIETIEIARISFAEILNETYTIPDNLRAFKRKDAGESPSFSDMVPLVLSLKEISALNSFRTLFHSTPELDRQDDGSYICRMNVENSVELALRIIQCGPSAKILGPQSYKKRFLALIDGVRGQYD